MKLPSMLTLAAAAVMTLAAPAWALPAGDAQPDYPGVWNSTLTRAQVQAELREAQRSGATRVWSASYNHMAAAKSERSRDEVRAEVLALQRQAGANLVGEDSGSFALSPVLQQRSSTTRLAAR